MSTNNKTDNGKPGLSNEQKQKLKKYAVFASMGVIFAGCMWFIFAPSADDKAAQEAQAGFNTEIPDPKSQGMIGDKRDAYEQEQMQQKQSERMRTLADFSSLLGDSASPKTDNPALIEDEPASLPGTDSGNTSGHSPIGASAMAYNDINRALDNFYETPKEDPEKEDLKRQIAELQAQTAENENRKNTADEQLDLMEKSLQMAARYMPGTAGTQGAAVPSSGGTPEPVATATGSVSGKTAVTPVTQVREQTVSALLPEISNVEFIQAYSQPRNMGFLTATEKTDAGTKNTIAACIHADQTIMNGQSVRLRLLEPMQVGHVVVPRNTILSAAAKITGERLGIAVHSLETNGMILSVDLTAYDTDGQNGIFIPDMQTLNAAKEIIANMGANAGTSINLSDDAGGQFVADMGRNLIQGVSQFTAKKLREVKVHLKAGYRVLLLPGTN